MSISLSTLGAALRLATGRYAIRVRRRYAGQRTGAGRRRTCGSASDAVTPTVAAAASLRYALDEIAKRYEKDTGKTVKITYGATGNLVHQIEAGAPFEALFAADDESVKKLAKAGKTEGEPIVFARGELSVAAPKGSPVAIDADLKGLKEALAAGKVKHVAIANPGDGAVWPRRAGIVEEGRAVGAGAAAARHRREHRADGDVRVDRRRRGGVHRQVARHLQGDRPEDQLRPSSPASWHEPIDHGMAVIKDASPDAKAFADFVRGPQGREVLEASGFSVPTS